ncbi:restriction endonuclease subunit S [Campylobacter lanienae]|uniref:restriction endonuclease subunit S n=1 Tax=Campylobacter lanienae TaxID=75658 RepID=UPI002A91D965|nr:restriction endonuclease subunit S [Campylobacter lanienae]MDY6134970.1 restriction endonuclease subunit S [Campylobacter lanienae]
MSKLDELINKLCPNGVEFKKIGKVSNFVQGFAFKNNTFKENGIGLVRTTNIQDKSISEDNMVYIKPDEYKENLSKYIIKKDRIIIGMSGTIKVGINNSDKNYYLNQRVGMFIANEEIINNKYLFYVLDNSIPNLYNLVSGSSVKNLSSNVLNDFEIPVPPLEVQCEIVRILDNFTLLSAELSAELSARQKQYQFYLDSIYENIKENNVTLGSLGSLIRGKRFVHADRVDVGVPCMHYGELYTFYGVHAKKVKSHIREELRPKMRYANKNDVIIVGAGENRMDIGIGVAWEGDEDIAVHDACYTLKHKQNPKYISYFLRTSQYHNQIKKFVSEGKICSISAEGLKKAIIPIPSLEKQNKIVNILDKFDKLCNDISEGLPAEIEARKKQYEYYRDKLLTFKELKK